MSARSLGLAFGIVALGASTLSAAPASADEAGEKIACARAYERGQRLRRSHELRAARDELLVCSRAECPATLRRDCEQWLGQVEASTPTIVVVARNADGRPASDARIRVDGELVGDQAARAPIPLDPGAHVIRLEAPGASSVEEHVTLHEGERGRRMEVTFAAAAARGPVSPVEEGPPRPPAPPGAAEHEGPDRPVPTLSWILGGGGLVVAAIGGYFQLSGMSKRSDLSACAPRCAQSDVDDARRTLWVGNIALGAGIVALAAATIVYLTR